MTTYKSERSHKKLLVPVVALLLCAAAMVGLGYAALTSDVTNTANVVTADGLKASLLDGEDGTDLVRSDFASGEDIGVIDYYTSTEDGEITYYAQTPEEIKLGGGWLKIEALASDEKGELGIGIVGQVYVWYDLKWSGGDDKLYDMNDRLKIDIGDGRYIEEGLINKTLIPLDEGVAEFEVTLYGVIDTPYNIGNAAPTGIPTYSITFYVVPA